MSHRRNRSKPTLSFTQRLVKAAEEARAKAEVLEPGNEKEALLDKARQFETQLGMNEFLTKHGAQLD